MLKYSASTQTTLTSKFNLSRYWSTSIKIPVPKAVIPLSGVLLDVLQQDYKAVKAETTVILTVVVTFPTTHFSLVIAMIQITRFSVPFPVWAKRLQCEVLQHAAIRRFVGVALYTARRFCACAQHFSTNSNTGDSAPSAALHNIRRWPQILNFTGWIAVSSASTISTFYFRPP